MVKYCEYCKRAEGRAWSNCKLSCNICALLNKCDTCAKLIGIIKKHNLWDELIELYPSAAIKTGKKYVTNKKYIQEVIDFHKVRFFIQ